MTQTFFLNVCTVDTNRGKVEYVHLSKVEIGVGLESYQFAINFIIALSVNFT